MHLPASEPIHSNLPPIPMDKAPPVPLRSTLYSCKRLQPLRLTQEILLPEFCPFTLVSSSLPLLLDLSHQYTNIHFSCFKNNPVFDPTFPSNTALFLSFILQQNFSSKYHLKVLSPIFLLPLTLEFTSIRPYLHPFYLNYF